MREGCEALAGSKHLTAKEETEHIFVSRGEGGGFRPLRPEANIKQTKKLTKWEFEEMGETREFADI